MKGSQTVGYEGPMSQANDTYQGQKRRMIAGITGPAGIMQISEGKAGSRYKTRRLFSSNQNTYLSTIFDHTVHSTVHNL